MLFGHIWHATRFTYFIALSVFVPLYYVAVVPIGYEATATALIAQPLLLAAIILAWCATGSIRRGASVSVLLLLLAFAAVGIEVVARIATGFDKIEAWHNIFLRNDPNLAPLLQLIGPIGSFSLFLAAYGLLTALLLAGAIASAQLHLGKMPGIGLRLPALLSAARRYAATAGHAPGMLRQIEGGRLVGLLIATCAAVVLLLPLLLPGQAGRMPLPVWSVETWVPTIIAYLVVVLTDRVYAWPIAFVVALLLWRLARRFLSPDAKYMLTLDRRPPLLLLRSFADDPSHVKPSSLWARLCLRRKRLEEVAGASVAGAGPFIAVGDPSLSLPHLGAFRAVLPDSGWQKPVQNWINQARAIVLIGGTTPWVTWEIEQIVAAKALDRVLLLVPPGSPADIEARWNHVATRSGSDALQSAMQSVNSATILAARFTPEGGLVVMTGSARRERDYDLAMQVGLHAILAAHADPALAQT